MNFPEQLKQGLGIHQVKEKEEEEEEGGTMNRQDGGWTHENYFLTK